MKKKLICVLCGQDWGINNPFTNKCENLECKGFCSWGYTMNKPESFIIDSHEEWHFNLTPDIDENK